MSSRTRLVVVSIAALVFLGNTCTFVVTDSSDLLFYLDPFDANAQRPAEIVAGAPWIQAGPDGEYETEDDDIRPWLLGDADLVVRSGISSLSGSFPASHDLANAPVASAEPFGSGIPVAFVVAASTPAPTQNLGVPVDSPSLSGVPVVVAAFADLDGDGFVGVTLLDGDALDFAIEEAELEPIGRAVAIARNGQASGVLSLQAGGPAGAPLAAVLTAAAYAGAFDPAFLNGVVPDGPLVTTELPFVPRTDPHRAIDFGPGGPGELQADSLLAVNFEAAYQPDPADLRIGESFTIPTDGSAQTVSLVVGTSGAQVRFGLGRVPVANQYAVFPERPLRPGLDEMFLPSLYEILSYLTVPDDGAGSQISLRVLPLDRLGNVADLAGPASVTVSTGGSVRIVSPDTDSDPHLETIVVGDARGVEIVVDDTGGTFDDANRDLLVVDDGNVLVAIDVVMPDPDVDDSGLVDSADVWAIASLDGFRLGDDEYDATLDLNGDGRIDDDDVAEAMVQLGAVAIIP